MECSNHNTMPVKLKSRMPLLLGLMAFLIAGAFAVRNLATWSARLLYPGTEGYEGIPMTELVNLRRGVAIYALPSAQGFDAAFYGPLYYLLGSRLINPGKPSYFPLRILSVMGTLGCAACCGVLALWLSRSYFAALLSPLVFLSYAMVTRFGTAGLSDALALLLFFSGFLVAYRFRCSRAVLLGTPLMVLGFFYKPQYIAGPIAVVSYLLIDKRLRLAAEFVALLALFGLGLLKLFQEVVFPGQAFWRHFLVYSGATLSAHRIVPSFFVFSILLLLPLLFAIPYLRTHQDKLISYYLLWAVSLGGFTFCRSGSNIQYFLESVVVLSILFPVMLAGEINQRANPLDLVLVLGLMLLAGQAFGTHPPAPSDFTKYSAVQTFLHGNFPAHASALGSSPGDLVQAGLEVSFPDLYQVAELSRRGLLSDRGLAAQIHARRFSTIVLDINLAEEKDPAQLYFFLTEPLREAISHDYELGAALEVPDPEKTRPGARFCVYVPRAAPALTPSPSE
jgi:hypothetical protein